MNAYRKILQDPMSHPVFICGWPQLQAVIEELEAGTYPPVTADVIPWREDIPREWAIRLARACGATDEDISAVQASAS
jgi:hypothetical protein